MSRGMLPLAVADVIRAVRSERLTYLDVPALTDLALAMSATERDGVPGAVIEAGVALGGSAVVLAAAKSRSRALQLYDVFAMIPPPSESDGLDVISRYEVISSGASAGIDGDEYYGYRPNLQQQVETTLERFGFGPGPSHISLIAGRYEVTFHPSYPVAFAHVDCDWYESVKTVLQRVAPVMAAGGRIVIDDYDAWSGCRRAVDEFLADASCHFDVEHRERLHLVCRHGEVTHAGQR